MNGKGIACERIKHSDHVGDEVHEIFLSNFWAKAVIAKLEIKLSVVIFTKSTGRDRNL